VGFAFPISYLPYHLRAFIIIAPPLAGTDVELEELCDKIDRSVQDAIALNVKKKYWYLFTSGGGGGFQL
jgi:hypothetical protein